MIPARHGVVGVVIVACLALPALAAAEIYRWIDDRGSAHYADNLSNVPDPYRSRAEPVGLGRIPVTESGPRATWPTRSTATIRFTPGERIMVEATINGRSSVRLLLDTGADRTLIAPRALDDAGVSMRGAIKGAIVGVTGRADAHGVTVDSLEVQDARVSGMLVIAYDMKSPGVDGLLGRDFLEHFNVNIDSVTGVVTIGPK
jgi:aspartyl protease/uncharacterized protein DUF4124